MKDNKGLCRIIISGAFLTMAAFAYAQQSNDINVNISNVADSIAKKMNINVDQIPAAVQAPTEVAAKVCNVGVDVLKKQAASPNASCSAEKSSEDLEKIIRMQLKGATQK